MESGTLIPLWWQGFWTALGSCIAIVGWTILIYFAGYHKMWWKFDK